MRSIRRLLRSENILDLIGDCDAEIAIVFGSEMNAITSVGVAESGRGSKPTLQFAVH